MVLGAWIYITKRNYKAKVVSKVDLDERRRDEGDAGPIIVSNVQGRLKTGRASMGDERRRVSWAEGRSAGRSLSYDLYSYMSSSHTEN